MENHDPNLYLHNQIPAPLEMNRCFDPKKLLLTQPNRNKSKDLRLVKTFCKNNVDICMEFPYTQH